ncbi:chemosensory receptor B [Elysia marginata]|uniref:Chemosensory receptor B n=1 Tax=Elysia marginata TaxID=1093978 RepID=A0AAV4HQC0_9GAST|nr:chemosensory receptor B [Elysia marginata]
MWDLIKCIAGVMNNCSGIVALFDPIAAQSWLNISTAIFNYLVCFSSYVTSVMAAYVAVERCLCVTVPLKVKWLLTPKVTLLACLVISVVVFGAFAAMFALYDLVRAWDATLNASIVIYKKSQFYIENDGPLFAYYNISGILWPLASFVVILIATIIIIVKLREGSKFRLGQSSTAASQPEAGSSSQGKRKDQQQRQQNVMKRDRQVVKMLLVIIIIYIASLAPRIAHYMVKYFVYDYYFLRRSHYLFEFTTSILMIADSTNGAVNFFVFYKMSSSFRVTLSTMFSRSKTSRPTQA